jgi:hypothetical protein
MVNTARIQSNHISVKRRLQQPQQVTPLRSVRPDNPTQSPAPPATPQPAPPKNTVRTTPKKTHRQPLHKKKTYIGKDVQLNLWVRPVVKSELERVAKREGLSVSSAGEALLEKALQQDMYTQHQVLLETILDRAIGRHLRVYSDRNASLQARTLKKVEFLIGLTTNILGRQQGIDEAHMERILNDADDAARASITRTTPSEKKVIADEKAVFDRGGGESRDSNGNF